MNIESWKINIKDKKEYIISFLSLLVVYLFFNVVLVDKFFPVTEGWFQDYSRYINEGKFIYRDFYVPIPPGFVWLTTLLNQIFNDNFLLFRIYGILERLILVSIVFNLMIKVYTYKITFIALLTASIIYISNIQDVFYGFYQSSLLFSIIALYLSIKMIENYDKNLYFYSVLFGCFSAISFLFKQTLGTLTPFALGIAFVLLTFKKDIKRTIISSIIAIFSALFMIGIICIYLNYNDALIPCINQIFKGASSKGSISSIFISFLPRMINKGSLKLALIFILYFGSINLYLNIKNKKIKNIIKLLIIFLPIVILYKFFIYTLDINLLLNNYLGSTVILVLGLIITAYIFYKNLNQQKEYNKIFFVSTTVYCISILYYITHHNINFVNFLLIRDYRQLLIYFGFYFNLFWIFWLVKKNDVSKINNVKLLILIASLLIMYTHGMSFIVEDHGTLLLFSLLISEALSIKIPYNNLKNVYIFIFCILTIFSIMIQRCNFPYHWWGINTLPSIMESKYSYSDPNLFGFKGNLKNVNTMNKIYDLIEKNKKTGDTMYTFPHINYFNVMSKLDTPTFGKVHYFDVCPDKVAVLDADILYKHKPTFLVYQELPEETWKIHEQIFRNGNESGQRKIEEFIEHEINNKSYTLLGIFTISNSNPIYVWGLLDGRNWNLDKK